MGRKNKRKKSAYYRKLRMNQKMNPKMNYQKMNPKKMNPKKLVPNGAQQDRGAAVLEHTDSADQVSVRTPQRGEIWFAEFGSHPGTSVQEGCRPALIISNDTANFHSSTVTVIPMTSRMKKGHLPIHVAISPYDVEIAAGQYMERSMILAEQVTTIGKDALVRYVGKIREDKLKETETALMVQMNITVTPAATAAHAAAALATTVALATPANPSTSLPAPSATSIEEPSEARVLHQSEEMISYGS